MRKLLIIRFSSFGDILHGLSIPVLIKQKYPESHVAWAVRSDFKEIVEANIHIDQVHAFDRNLGLLGLFRYALKLRGENYTHIYDAHNNLRSHIVCWFLRGLFLSNSQFIRRSKQRWKRFLLFQFKKNLFPKPFRSAWSFVHPIVPWLDSEPNQLPNIELTVPAISIDLPEKFTALAPSAAWPMKRWPVEHWKQLIQSLPSENFAVLGGPTDSFCEDIRSVAPDRVINLAGKCGWLDNCAVIKKAKCVVSADTGVMHLADHLGAPTLALIGPTAFGFPSFENSRVLQVDLPCRPCTKDGRGKCSQQIYQRCMVEISVERVAQEVENL